MKYKVSFEREKDLETRMVGAIEYVQKAFARELTKEQIQAWLERHIEDEQYRIFMKKVGVFTKADLIHWREKNGLEVSADESKTAHETEPVKPVAADKPKKRGRPAAVKPVEPEPVEPEPVEEPADDLEDDGEGLDESDLEN